MTQQDIIQRIVLRPEGAAVTERALEAVRAELAGIDSDMRAVNNTGGSFNLGGIGGRLGGVRNVLGTAGGLASAVGGGQAVSALSSVLGLTAALGPLGLAAGGAAVLLKSASDAETARTEAAQKFVELVGGTAGQTSVQLQQQIDGLRNYSATLNESKNVLQDFRDRVQAQNDAYNYGFASADEYANNIRNISHELNDFSGGTVKLSDDLNYMGDNLNKLDAALTKAQTGIDESSGKIAFLGVQLGTAATAANDAAAAAEAFQKSLQSGVTKALQDAIKAGAEVEKRFSEARTQQNDAYMDAMDIEAKLRDEITDTLAKIADIQAERDRQISEIVAEGEDRRGEILADAADRRAEIEADAADQMQEIAQDSADRIARILRDAGRAQFAAVAARDALAFYQAQIQRDDALEDEKQSRDRQVAALMKSLRKQEDELNKSLAKQLDAQAKAQQKQIAQLMQSSQRQIDIQQRGLTQQQQDLQNAVASRLNIESNMNSGLLGMSVAHWNAMIGVAYQGGLDMVSAFRSAVMQGLAAGGLAGAGAIGPGGIGGVLGSQSAFNRAFDNRFAQTMQTARGR